MPVAFMVSSNATEVTINHFLSTIHQRDPDVNPARFMSDKDRAQMNAILRCFPKSKLILCWWHVLHAWQQHFITDSFPELWRLLKSWIRITTATEFEAHWQKIQDVAPPSVKQYLRDNWMNEQELWSAVHRQGRSIDEESDTNMLTEAYANSFFTHFTCILIPLQVASSLKRNFSRGKAWSTPGSAHLRAG